MSGRRRIIRLDARILLEVMTEEKKWNLTTAGVPKGSSLVGVNYDPYSAVLVLTVEHESFDEIPEGDKIPEFKPEFATGPWPFFEKNTPEGT